ncbi:DEKNAAC104790 [Brettanomyces naardenensis]|uniref:DEKNAAC104790 n=1 Tax=Brettanomyces naardenensis TaxID=13370 RepID=A0A448YRU3_BRENA|nr:DEKNAAC104790 [Brettanomyces naardenensis]
MDPTHDPNFQPPSTNPNFEPPVPSKLIPNHTPIQPYALSDDVDSGDSANEDGYLGSQDSIDAQVPIGSSYSEDNHPLSSTLTETAGTSLPTTRRERAEKRKEQTLKHKIPKLPTELEPSSSSSNVSEEEGEVSHGNFAGDVISEGALSDEDGPREGVYRIERRQYSTASIDNEPLVHSFQIADLEEVPHGIPRQSTTLEEYEFPIHRLKTHISDPNKYPVVIVACGSFSPITYLHLRMFEMALDSIRESTKFEVIGGYYSPVSDNYSKPGLAPSSHRVRMCELACERTSSWLMVDAWESLQPKYTRTALVLDHFNKEINIKRGGVLRAGRTTEKVGVKIMLLAGGDLIESMGEPNVWAEQDLHHILGNYGCLIVERTGSDVRSFLLSHDIMYEHRKNILVIKQLIYNDISSTKVRLFIRRHMSVRYLLPNSVIRYIQEHRLYVNDKEPVKVVLGRSEQ